MDYVCISPFCLPHLLHIVLHHQQALVKRSPSSGMGSTLKESSAFQSELRMPENASRHQSASPSDKGKVTICDGKPGDEERPKKSSVCKSIAGCQEELLSQVVRKIMAYYWIDLPIVLITFLKYVITLRHCSIEIKESVDFNVVFFQ